MQDVVEQVHVETEMGHGREAVAELLILRETVRVHDLHIVADDVSGAP